MGDSDRFTIDRIRELYQCRDNERIELVNEGSEEKFVKYIIIEK